MAGGPFHIEDEPEAQTFIKFLYSWGSSWMWNGLVYPKDLSWMADVFTNDTIGCVTGGSYDQKKALDICTAGWIIYCTTTKHHISAYLIKRYDSTGSYRS